jgi:uncharacterized membrane protein (DUF2068 family)
MSSQASGSRGLLFIAAFKLAKGLLLLAVGVGALRLLHQDVAVTATHWINALRVDPGNFFIHHLLARLANVDDQKLKEVSFGTFFYAALSLTEGIGLAFRKRWAEYFTTILTASFIPLELWEIHRHLTEAKILILAINIAVLAYLIWELRRPRPRPH